LCKVTVLMINNTISINEVIDLLNSKPQLVDILKLIVGNEIDCFVKRPREFAVYSADDTFETIHEIKRRTAGPLNEMMRPVEVEDVRYLALCECDVKDLLSVSCIEVSRFSRVLVGNLLKIKYRPLCYFRGLQDYFFIARENEIKSRSGVYTFSNGFEVRAPDVHILSRDFDKLKMTYFSEFIKSHLVVSNAFVTIMNLCAYEYYKDDLERKYIRDDVVNLIKSMSVDGVRMTNDNAMHFSAIINRKERSWDRVGEGAGDVFAIDKLPVGVLESKRHESFTVKLTVINYLFHALEEKSITKHDFYAELERYGFKKILAERVGKFLLPSPQGRMAPVKK